MEPQWASITPQKSPKDDVDLRRDKLILVKDKKSFLRYGCLLSSSYEFGQMWSEVYMVAPTGIEPVTSP